MEAADDVAALRNLAAMNVESRDYPFSATIEKNVVIYDASEILRALERGEGANVQAELHACLQHGPGVFVVRNLQPGDAVCRMSSAFKSLIEREKNDGGSGSDHFAGHGLNDRLWNAAEKTCVEDPRAFVDYYKNTVLALICAAWLGPNWQLTSQLNAIRPGGLAQAVHRDYHLGFQNDDVVKQFPRHVHKMSSMLTLQGAIAHGPISVLAGATKLLPFSQQYESGYLTWRKAEVQALFEECHIALPLESGDGLFFNPALLHAGGHNKTEDVYRMANLLQISSCMGRPMEVVDHKAMVIAAYPVLLEATDAGHLESSELDAICTALCDCYPFPTNLDRDPPETSSSPTTMKQHLLRALQRKDPDPSIFLSEYLSRRLPTTAFRRESAHAPLTQRARM